MEDHLKIIKQISQQKESSITVLAISGLLSKAKVPRIQMGYDSWGNPSLTQVLYILDKIGYIVKRKEKNKALSVIIQLTKDFKVTECGRTLTDNEIKVFKELGLNC